jgi:outer membrane protein TolC
VELKAEQQRLMAQRNQVEKDKITLARAIGLPVAQPFTLIDTLPFSPITVSEYDLLREAYDNRADYKAAQASLRAAQYALEAAKSEQYWPQAVVQGDYGVIGSTLGSSHGTYDLVAGVRIPIFAGNRGRADITTAETVLADKRTVLEDLRGRVAFEVRSALLDLQSYAEQVSVARSNVELATEALAQSRDRFSAGVADNVEVVQAQQSLAVANEDLITALGAHNEAKIALARAVGVAEQDVPRYLNLK